ncbi:MAG: hypothetical protein ACHQYQ_07545 [Bacteriovoracales bacterium]
MKKLIFLGLFFCHCSFSQISKEKLAEEVENPISYLMRIPIQDNYGFGIGPYDRAQNKLILQPVIPFHLTPNLNLIIHTFIPYIWWPDIYSPSGTYTGLSNIEVDFYFSQTNSKNFFWGIGPSLLFPTSTNSNITAKETGLGVNLSTVWTPSNWVFGILIKQIWSVGGPDMSKLDLNYFVNLNFSNGYYLTTSPNITLDWEKEPGEQWVIPFGLGMGKVFKLGKRYLNSSLQGYYAVVTPTPASEWTIRAQIAFLFPK